MRLRTFAALRPVRPVFCHWSALAIHGLPFAGRHPRSIHILARGEREHLGGGIVQHARRDDTHVLEVQGLLVTTAARTVADVASRSSLMSGVMAADAALACGAFSERRPKAQRSDIAEAARGLPADAGRERALAVAEFADGQAESALESASRVSMALCGAPPPALQQPVEDLLGFRARLDFVWPELGLVGEADGVAKMVRPDLLDGRSRDQALEDRRRRESLIRAMGLRVVRWGWKTAMRPDLMRVLLRDAGVPLSVRSTFPRLDLPAVGWDVSAAT